MQKKLFIALCLVLAALPVAARFDFSLTVGSGQRLYFLIGSDSASVSVVYPGYSGNYYSGATSPTGQLIVPESVTYMGTAYRVDAVRNRAFSGCAGLTTIILPSTVRYVGNYAMAECPDLRTVHMNEGLDSMAANALRGCPRLTTVVVPQSLRTIGANAFAECTSLASISLGNNVQQVGDAIFSNCTALQDVDLGTSTPEVSDNMFSGCTSLRIIHLPSSIRRIGSYAFDGCTALVNIGIDEGPESVGDYAFYHCERLVSVRFPSTVRTIGTYAFYYCASLKRIYLGSGTTGIGADCFLNCSSIERIVVHAPVPPTLGERALGNVAHEMEVYVPCGRLSVYEQTIVWRLYSHEMVENCNAVGIDEASTAAFDIHADGGAIVVGGSQGEPIVAADMAGRLLFCGRTTDPMRIELDTRGVVVVRVGQHPAKKIIL